MFQGVTECCCTAKKLTTVLSLAFLFIMSGVGLVKITYNDMTKPTLCLYDNSLKNSRLY